MTGDRNRVALLAAAIMIRLAAAPGVTRGQDEPNTAETPYDCGPLALYTILRLEGRDADLDRIESLLPMPRAAGSTLKELQVASRVCGLSLFGARLDDGSLSLDRPAIVYLQRRPHGHFIVVRPLGRSGSRVQVFDPAGPPRVLDAADLADRSDWTGLALLPERSTRFIGAAIGTLVGAAFFLVALDHCRRHWLRRRTCDVVAHARRSDHRSGRP